MYKKRTIGVICSATLHILLAVYILSTPVIPKKPPPPIDYDDSMPISVRLIPHEQPSKNLDILKGNKDALAYPTDPRICSNKDKMYRGVGIMHNFGSQMIVYAPEFYPGYKAGLRVGDFILNPTRKEVNGYIDFVVLRGYTKLYFHIKTDNICYNNG